MYVAQPQHHLPPHLPPSLPAARLPSNAASLYSDPSAPSQANMLPSLPRSPPAPPSRSAEQNGRIYSLEVVQQPIRARMCGFGDKDRRPITPPPCIRLVVRDAKTGKEVDINEIDTTFHVLTVDLWSAEGTREVNLVRHSATSPSISNATSSSYPPTASPPAHPAYAYQPPAQQYPPPPQQYPPPPQQYQNPYGQPLPPQQHHYPPPPPPQPGYYGPPGAPPPPINTVPGGYYVPPLTSPSHQQLVQPGSYTRNLIGALSVSAFKLTDPDNKIGVWFILQDLSVRTEGTFRLKMNFINVGEGNQLTTGSAPVLASTFSEPFQVFSAKKFPGVIESTPLSKCFATQGIKIPIRKDGPKAINSRDDYENDD